MNECKCESCDWEGMDSDTGSTGYLNGNLPVCPMCGAVDMIEDLPEEEQPILCDFCEEPAEKLHICAVCLQEVCPECAYECGECGEKAMLCPGCSDGDTLCPDCRENQPCQCAECGRTDICEPGDVCVECDGYMEVPEVAS